MKSFFLGVYLVICQMLGEMVKSRECVFYDWVYIRTD